MNDCNKKRVRKNRPREYDNCPDCDKLKTKISKRCLECFRAPKNTTERVCNYCKQLLPISDFITRNPNKIKGLGNVRYGWECRNCAPIKRRKRKEKAKQANPEKVKRQSVQYALNRNRIITNGDREQIIDKIIEQKNCDICKKHESEKGSLHIDHCHDTNKFRGLLCFNCNSAIGSFQDSIENLENAILYLKRAETN